MLSAPALLRRMPAAFEPRAAADAQCVVQFNISAPMHLVIRDGGCEARDGEAPAADVCTTMDDDDLVALLRGEHNGMTALMTGKLQLEGDLALAQRMFAFFDARKLV